MNQIIQEQQEVIPQEIIAKFDNDQELVQKFLEQGYDIEDLKNCTISHPTVHDPVAILNGHVLGFWVN